MTQEAYVEHIRKYLDPKTVASLAGLGLQARTVVEGYLSGMHRSPYHGVSVEFVQHREYVPGDDIRHVDWKVWSRTDKYYLKQYEEETNLRAYFWLDCSESMSYSSGPISKFQYARLVVAALSYLVLQQQDSAGLVLFDESVRQYVRASNQPSHIKQLLHVLESAEPSGKTKLGTCFHELAERLEGRSLVIVVSDFFGDVDDILSGVQHLRHKRHDVIAMQIVDGAEVDFPFRDSTLFEGMEELPDVLTDPRALRAAYQREFHGFLRRLERGCRSRGVDYVLIRTDSLLDKALSAYLAARNRRLQRR